eukprot:gb/GECG01013524.1/.p1 GENE.gb/GECG01013524.1/~~gb/GECG01013524.1/.p1  ORF type:complete len:175 (+),score=16.66 gb/GECG01013524.1/:1-525(+)
MGERSEHEVISTTNALHSRSMPPNPRPSSLASGKNSSTPKHKASGGRSVKISDNLPTSHHHERYNQVDREGTKSESEDPPDAKGRQLVRAYSMSGAAMERNRRRRSILKQSNDQEDSPRASQSQQLVRRVSFADTHQQDLEQIKEVPNTHYGPDADHDQFKKKKRKRKFRCQIL